MNNKTKRTMNNDEIKIKNIIEKMQKKVYTEIGMYNSEKKGET